MSELAEDEIQDRIVDELNFLCTLGHGLNDLVVYLGEAEYVNLDNSFRLEYSVPIDRGALNQFYGCEIIRVSEPSYYVLTRKNLQFHCIIKTLLERVIE